MWRSGYSGHVHVAQLSHTAPLLHMDMPQAFPRDSMHHWKHSATLVVTTRCEKRLNELTTGLAE